eukprot:gene5172-biopygen10146
MRFMSDMKASFFQVELPVEIRALFRCYTEDSQLVELCRLLMGYTASPEILRILTSALAGKSGVVKPEFAAPSRIRVDVWIDNIRTSGSRGDVATCTETVLPTCTDANVTLGEVEKTRHRYPFIGVFFDHARRRVAVG